MKRRFAAALIAGLASAAVAILLGRIALFRTIEWKTYDLRVQLTSEPASARPDIVLVVIDEDSIEKLEPVVGRFPWPRLVHAQLLDYLARAPAKVVAYDVLFNEHDTGTFRIGDEEWTGEESDRAFADSMARAGMVVLAADASHEEPIEPSAPGGGSHSDLPGPLYTFAGAVEERPGIDLPLPLLAGAARSVGHVFLTLDSDGPVRRSVPFVRGGGLALPSLPLAAAAVADGLEPSDFERVPGGLRIGTRMMPLVEGPIPSFYGETRRSVRSLIRYQGPSASGTGGTYAEYSFYRLIYSEEQILAGEKPMVDPGVFRGRVVIVGTTAAGLSDLFTTPFSQGKMPGIEVHANVIDNVLSGRFMRPAGAGWNQFAVVSLSMLASVAALWAGIFVAVAASVLAAAAFGWLATVLFAAGIWVELTAPFTGITLAAFAGVGYRYFQEGREKKKVKAVFSHYVSRGVYDLLLADPSRARLGGDRRDMTVLFSDIRGFTSISERGEPEDVVAQLNEYFSRMVAVLFRHKGTVDKFVGDMVMALFGAPVSDSLHADNAVAASLEMIGELDSLNRKWLAEGKPQVEIGIGINSGTMIAGNIGSDQIMSYTVVGDAVNLASRLESLNKDYGTRIIISDETLRRLKGQYDIQPLGQVVVKGRSRAVGIHSVVARGPAGSPADRDRAAAVS